MQMMNLGFFAGVEYNNKIYFSACQYNGLFEMDLMTKRVRVVGLFEKEKLKRRLHRAAFLYKNFAWFIPQEGEYIAKVNLENMVISYFEFSVAKKNENVNNGYHAFVCGKKFGDKKLCLIPRDVDTVVVVDMETNEIEELYDAVDVGKECTMDACILGEELFLFFKAAGYYRRINLVTGIRTEQHIEDGVSSVCNVEKDIWILTAESKKIIQYDLDVDKIVDEIILNENKQYNGAVRSKDEIIFLPIKAPGFLRLNIFSHFLYEDIPTNVSLPNHFDKTTLVDSEGKQFFIVGDMGLLVEMTDQNDFAYTRVQIETKDFFEGMSKYIKGKSGWKEFCEEASIYGLEAQIGLEGFLKVVEYMDVKENNI